MSMRRLPHQDPGVPDLRSALAYLLWTARGQWRTLALGVVWAVTWFAAQAIVPAALGAGVQAASEGRQSDVLRAAALLAVLGVVQSAAGILRHRMAVTNWIAAASRVQQLVVRHTARLGSRITRDVATGEVVAVTSSDVEKIGSGFDVFARFAGAVVAFIGVAIVLFRSSPALGLVVVIGVPILGLSVAPLLKPLERRESDRREKFGKATELASDTVAGLRVLRGIGGEELFVRRFHDASQEVRTSAVQVARLRSTMDALQVALPGFFVVAVTWLSARLVVSGSLEIGELVAFYGWSAFLLIPLRTFVEAAHRWTSSYVGAGRVVALLRLPVPDETGLPMPLERAARGALHDPASGLTVQPRILTAVVCAEQSVADSIALRLAGLGEGADAVTLDGVRLGELARADVRAAVVTQDKDPVLMSGTLAQLLDVPRSGRVRVQEAVEASSAYDVLDALVDGSPEVSDPMQARITERGRSLSGGQRQRLALVRSFVADPPVLVLDEPTSAVDSHTEARIALSLREMREGRTTVVLTSSPLMLDVADRVALVLDGRVVAEGRHRDLLHTEPRYRAVVTREEVNAP
jgi:ABC-type multidrug transport system fused ATPase/permease subunit